MTNAQSSPQIPNPNIIISCLGFKKLGFHWTLGFGNWDLLTFVLAKGEFIIPQNLRIVQ